MNDSSINSAEDLELVFGLASVDEADPQFLASFMRNFRKNFPVSLNDDRQRRAATAAHLRDVAGPTVEHCWTLREMMREALSWASTAVGAEIERADGVADSDSAEIDRIYEWYRVMVGISVQGLDVLGEVITLTEAGFPDGALARVRTLHELAVVALVLTGHGTSENRLVERFQAHQEAFLERTTKRLLATGEPGVAEMFDETVITSIRSKAALLEEEYGKQFMRPNGWAAPIFPDGKNISFERMSQLVATGLEFVYSNASNHVHAGSEAWNERVRRLERDEQWSIGPSVRDLDLPLELATGFAMALVEITVPSFVGIGQARDETGAAYLSAIRAVQDERPKTGAPESDPD